MDTCKDCKGQKYISRVDFMKARTVKEICPTCKGKGVMVVHQTDGVRVGRKLCEVFYFQEMRDDHVVATLHIHICPVLIDGKPQFKRKDAYSKPIPRIFVEIVNMSTRHHFRRQGIMLDLLSRALADPKIEYALTSYEDSTEAGRAVCEKFGFVRENTNLVWSRQEEAKE